MDIQATWSGEDLKAWRKEMGLNQAEAAAALGITMRAFQSRERDEARITRECILACWALKRMSEDAGKDLVKHEPGSEDARSHGCTCTANLLPTGKIAYVMEKGCPVHDAITAEDLHPNKRQDFIDQVEWLLDRAARRGMADVDIVAGEVHRAIGNYPGPLHRMPVCCEAMRSLMQDGDEIISAPPKGAGASLTIRYRLPRT